MAARVYKVEDDESVTLVKAVSVAKALSYVARSQYTVKIASGVDVMEYMQAGGVVEDAEAPEATETNGDESETTE